jgi:H-type small acid-soluble spore protein
MNLQRMHEILNNKEKCDVFYNERPVWIQEINDNIARIGFIDTSEEKDVYIEDLYEQDLYN